MKIHDVQQGTDEWLALRAGRITASECGNLVTPLFKIRTGEMVQTYLAKKLAEKWIGRPLPEDDFNSVPTEFGSILEQFARPYFEMITGTPVSTCGFITTDDDLCGCSPDGIVNGNEGVEIKCPGHKKHTKNLLGGELPEDHIIQVQFSLFVTGWDVWHFMSYRHDMPPLVLKVERDEKAQSAIAQAVSEFSERMAEGWDLLVKKNGGRLPKLTPRPQDLPPEDDNFDTTP